MLAAARTYLWITGTASVIVLIPVLVSHALFLRRVQGQDMPHARWNVWAALVSVASLSLVVAGLSTGSVRGVLAVYGLLALVWLASVAARAAR